MNVVEREMKMAKHTPGPWHFRLEAVRTVIFHKAEIGERAIAVGAGHYPDHIANARLIAAAPTQHEEMVRFLPIIERAEADPELWAKLAAGTGIATANAYRAAIACARGDGQ